jgi:hypothetical protein
MENIFKKIPIIRDYIKAKELSKKSINEFTAKKEALEAVQLETQNALELFGRVKIEVLERSLHPFVEQLFRIEDIELLEQRVLQNTSPVTKINNEDIENDIKLKATLAEGGAEAKTAAISYATIGTYPSVFSAISVLSGAAASNATLAFLGGSGMIAAELGAAVLGGLVAVPLIIASGPLIVNLTNKALKNAEQDAEKVKLFIEESDRAIVELDRIKDVSMQLHRLLITLESKFIHNIAMLAVIVDRSKKENIVEQWYNALVRFVARIFRASKRMKASKIHVADISDEDQRTIETIIFMGQTVKNVLDLSIINDEGTVSDETFHIISTTETYLKNSMSLA